MHVISCNTILGVSLMSSSDDVEVETTLNVVVPESS